MDTLTAPFTGAVEDPAYAYRNRDAELDANDQGIIDELTDELREDWGTDDSKGYSQLKHPPCRAAPIMSPRNSSKRIALDLMALCHELGLRIREVPA